MLELIPVELRPMSVLSLLLFGFGGIIGWHLHGRLASLEKTMTNKSGDIEGLSKMCENMETAIGSIKTDNRKMIDWIREDSKANWGRVEKSLSEIRAQLYKGGE